MNSNEIYDQILRKRTPEQKLRTASAMYFSARRLKAAWLHQQHPEWTEEQVQQELRKVKFITRKKRTADFARLPFCTV